MEWWCHVVARIVCVSLVSFFLLPVHYGVAAQLTKVRISYSSRSNSNTPFLIALNKGFFAEEGMDGLQEKPRSGRPREVTSRKTAQVVAMTLRPRCACRGWR